MTSDELEDKMNNEWSHAPDYVKLFNALAVIKKRQLEEQQAKANIDEVERIIADGLR